MRSCKKCGTKIKNRVLIDGKVRNLHTRTYCLDCSPFGSHNTRKIEFQKAKRKPEDREQKTLRQRDIRRKRKQQVVEYLGGQCSVCGYNKCMGALEFHHTGDEKKSFGLSEIGFLASLDRLLLEADKCCILCSNCHRELHSAENSEL